MVKLVISMGSCKNYLGKDGFIHNIYQGDQNASTVKKVWGQLDQLTKKVRAKGKRVLILTDLTKLGKTPLSARTAGLDLMRKLDFDKAAVFGGSTFNQLLVNTIVIASGRGFQIKYFSTEKEARDWLKIEYV